MSRCDCRSRSNSKASDSVGRPPATSRIDSLGKDTAIYSNSNAAKAPTKKKIEKIIISLFEEKDSAKASSMFQAHINEMIQQAMFKYTQDLMKQSSKIQQLEETMIKIRDQQQNIESLVNERISSLQSDIQRMSVENVTMIEQERQKRITSLRKLVERIDDKYKTTHSDVDDKRGEGVQQPFDQVSSSARDRWTNSISKSKSNIGSSQDILVSEELRSLATRLNIIEEKMRLHYNISESSALASTKTKIESSRIHQLEELVTDVQNQINSCEKKIRDLDADLRIASCKVVPDSSTENEDIQNVKKRLRELGKTTTTMCRSLQDGMSEVQSTSLSLYEWGTKVHQAIGKVAEKSGMSFNPCPNVPAISSAG